MQVQRGVRVLSGTDLRQLLTLNDVVPAVESAYLATAGQRAVMYPVIREPLPESGGVFGIKSGYWPDRGSLGLKVAGYWPRNRARGLENHQAMVVLVDPGTGVPQAIIDGNAITAIRTSAAGAVGLRHLARADAQTALIVGTGVQAEAQARAVDWWRPDIELLAFEPLDSGDHAMARGVLRPPGRPGHHLPAIRADRGRGAQVGRHNHHHPGNSAGTAPRLARPGSAHQCNGRG